VTPDKDGFFPLDAMRETMLAYSDEWTINPCRIEMEDGTEALAYFFRMDGPGALPMWEPPVDFFPAHEIKTLADLAQMCRVVASGPVDTDPDHES